MLSVVPCPKQKIPLWMLLVLSLCILHVSQIFPDKAQYPPEEEWDNSWSEGREKITVMCPDRNE